MTLAEVMLSNCCYEYEALQNCFFMVIQHWEIILLAGLSFLHSGQTGISEQLHKHGCTRGVDEPLFFCVFGKVVQNSAVFRLTGSFFEVFPCSKLCMKLSLEFEQTQHFWALHGDCPVLQMRHTLKDLEELGLGEKISERTVSLQF